DGIRDRNVTGVRRVLFRSISKEVNKAGITNILGYDGSKNIHGEAVKKLDLFSDHQLISALNRSDITCMVISEENEGIVKLEHKKIGRASCRERVRHVEGED